MAENLKKIVSAFQLYCKGADKDQKPVFSENTKSSVIVRVYEDGSAIPLCRYVERLCVTPRCNPKLVRDASSHEDDYGTCIYSDK